MAYSIASLSISFQVVTYLSELVDLNPELFWENQADVSVVHVMKLFLFIKEHFTYAD